MDGGGVARRDTRIWLAVAGVVALTAAVLLAMGRSAICRCGRVALWHGQVTSAENSQQVLDPYSATHLVHGLLFYAGGWLLLRRWGWRARLLAAVVVEAAWEVAENSPAVIDRYRSVTAALGYTGDSVLNSVGDIACMMAGFLLARALPWRVSVALGVALELLLLATIRDNLALNVLMLVTPDPRILAWQQAGG
ncbi:DUF2585 family protein [Sphingomonas sp.]|uniref:DUF2585 family protein n=1 Tax=Sphingomonas sp. TaxID=28214 RepID=UPI0035C7D962